MINRSAFVSVSSLSVFVLSLTKCLATKRLFNVCAKISQVEREHSLTTGGALVEEVNAMDVECASGRLREKEDDEDA